MAGDVKGARARRTTQEVLGGSYSSQASFISAIARGDDHALQVLYVSFAPLLREQARSMGVREDERGELVTMVLESFALHVMEEKRVPREIARYLVGALRNRARNAHRDDQRRRARYERAFDRPNGLSERIVAECHSEYGIRASRGAEDVPSTSGAIATLATRAAEVMTADERRLMVGLGRLVPMRELAGQLGISPATARVRVHRLRERFRKLAAEHLASLDSGERTELERFFRRAGVDLSRDTRMEAR